MPEVLQPSSDHEDSPGQHPEDGRAQLWKESESLISSLNY